MKTGPAFKVYYLATVEKRVQWSMDESIYHATPPAGKLLSIPRFKIYSTFTKIKNLLAKV